MTDLSALAKGLTGAQRAALLHPNAGGCSYRWARMGTLEALYSRGLVGRRGGLGSMFSPQTSINWPLTELGKALRAHLQGDEHNGTE